MEASRATLPAHAPPASSTTPAASRRPRYWPALLALYFLAPACGELISGSTPPLLFVQPFGLIFEPLLYGSSAILIHEIVTRRKLGWGNILLLGGAFGIFREGLVVQSWLTFMAKDSPSHSIGAYSVLGGVSWDWALNLTIYHAVISITIPFMLLGLFFPRRAHLPWLGSKGTTAFVFWLLIPCGLLAYFVAFKQFAKEGYAGPPLYSYLAVFALMIVAIVLGAFVRFPPPHSDLSRAAPRLWTVRLTCFALTILVSGLYIILPETKVPAPVAMILGAMVFGFGLWRVGSWSARVGWDARHQLAVVMGVLAYFVFIFAPLVEFGLRIPFRNGLTMTDILIFVALALFARRLKQRAASLTPAT